jgi:hypothetical protein
MAFYEGYTIEQFDRVLTISKRLLVFFGIVFAGVAIINQWLARRIARRTPGLDNASRLRKPNSKRPRATRSAFTDHRRSNSRHEP